MDKELLNAIQCGKRADVLDAINAGANVNAKYDESTPLSVACAGRCKFSIIEILIESGADVNTQTVHGKTALHTVCEYHGHRTDIVILLILSGARYDIKDKYGYTAPEYLMNGDIPWKTMGSLKLFLDHMNLYKTYNAELEYSTFWLEKYLTIDRSPITPSQFTMEKNVYKNNFYLLMISLGYLDTAKSVGELMTKRERSHIDAHFWNAITYASEYPDETIMEYALNNTTPDVNRIMYDWDDNEYTVLDVARCEGYKPVVKLLKQHSAKSACDLDLSKLHL